MEEAKVTKDCYYCNEQFDVKRENVRTAIGEKFSHKYAVCSNCGKKVGLNKSETKILFVPKCK